MPLRLVYVIPRRDAQSGSTPTSEWELERAEMALSQAECAVQSATKSEGKPVEVETAILSGDPAQVLINESQDVALVCVGTARMGASRFGSCTRLSRAAPRKPQKQRFARHSRRLQPRASQ